MRRARWKRKNVRRVGLRRRRPPAAGEGWLAVPCGCQGRKRPPLGEPSSPGKAGIHPASLFAAADRWSMKVAAWAKQQPLRLPGQRVAKWNARKEELVKCVLAPRCRRHYPPRVGSTGPAEDPSVPEGRAKSAQAPIRRPPSRGGPLHRSASKRFFSSTGRGAFSFWARPKGAPAAPRAVGRGGARERAQFSPQAETELSGLCDDAMGGAPPWERPPAGADIPRAAGCRPYGSRRSDRPAR